MSDKIRDIQTVAISSHIVRLVFIIFIPFIVAVAAVQSLAQSALSKMYEIHEGLLVVGLSLVTAILVSIIALWMSRHISRSIDALDSKRQESNAEFQAIFNNASDAIFVRPAENNPPAPFSQVNPAAAELLGYTCDELLTMTPFDLQSSTGRDEVLIKMGTTIQTGHGRYETKLTHRNGEEIAVEVEAHTFDYYGKHTVISEVRDIRERKHAEAEIARSVQEYRSLFENMTEGVVHCKMIFDENDVPVDFEYISLNPAFAAIIGVNDVVGRKISEVFPGIQQADPELFVTHGRVARGGKREQFDMPIATLDRWYSVALYSPKYGEFVSIFNDITERKTSEDALRESAEKYRSIFENSQFAILLSQSNTSKLTRFTEVNEVACELLGYTREELLGLTQKDVIPEDFQVMLADPSQLNSKQSTRHEATLKRRDGQTVSVEINVHFFDYKSQNMQVLLFRDITAAKSLEEQFRQSQKMEAIGQLAGGVAHDFNNLLTVILGRAGLAQNKLDPKSSLFEELEEISNAAEQASNLTRQLLAFSRKQTLAPKIVNLNTVINDMEKMLKRLIGENISLIAATMKDLWNVKVDPGQIEQVIINLAVNARDAMSGGGKLTLETGNLELDGEYARTHSEVVPGKFVVLAVSDTGHGMSEEVKSKIFEPFFTTKPVGKGTGLGLSTVFGIVKQSGGSINVYSEQGHGTSFKIYFPAIVGEEVDPVHTQVLPENLPRGHESILVVEDEEAVRSVTLKYLELLGYSVSSARNGVEALEFFATTKKPIDLLLTDMIMPQMNGYDLANAMHAKMPDMKVVFMSGYTPDSIVHNGILDSDSLYLSKPFRPQELARKVREALERVALVCDMPSFKFENRA